MNICIQYTFANKQKNHQTRMYCTNNEQKSIKKSPYIYSPGKQIILEIYIIMPAEYSSVFTFNQMTTHNHATYHTNYYCYGTNQVPVYICICAFQDHRLHLGHCIRLCQDNSPLPTALSMLNRIHCKLK